MYDPFHPRPLPPRRYGYIKDKPDTRDKIFHPRAAAPLPPRADLRPLFAPVPVEDQGDLGSCTANALAGAMEFLQAKTGDPHRDFSRLFIYYNERAMEGTVGSDAGAEIRDGVKSLAQKGVCIEDLWPYHPKVFAHRPPQICYINALHARAAEYHRILTLADLKHSIVAGFPVAFGFQVYESFESDAVAKSGRVPMPKRGFFRKERCLGGHAVLAVGYDDSLTWPGSQTRKSDPTGALIVRNSWGSDWGDLGYFYLPYGFILDASLSDDFWAITSATFERAINEQAA